MVRPIDLDPTRRLPLRPIVCAVLAALSDGPQPGIHVLDAVNATVAGRRLLGPGTLYRLLRELREQGFIERVETERTDERQVSHELTTFGRAVLMAEMSRLQRTLALGRHALKPVDS